MGALDFPTEDAFQSLRIVTLFGDTTWLGKSVLLSLPASNFPTENCTEELVVLVFSKEGQEPLFHPLSNLLVFLGESNLADKFASLLFAFLIPLLVGLLDILALLAGSGSSIKAQVFATEGMVFIHLK